MGEAPGREDGTVTRSAEVMPRNVYMFSQYFYLLLLGLTRVVYYFKYVGSFPVDDHCLDDQIEQLHTQLKALRVSLKILIEFKSHIRLNSFTLLQ